MTPNLANLAMGLGVAVLAYGSLGFLMTAGATRLDPVPTAVGVVILLVAAVWSRLSR